MEQTENESRLRLERWQGMWDSGNTMWQMTEFNPGLVRFWPELTEGRGNLRVLVPLCGSTLDMGWMYRQGHSVVGVEGVRIAADKLFAVENLEYDVTKVPELDGWKYESKDKRFTVYVCDIMNISKDVIGTFDVVFDRGALEAMKLEDRAGYVKALTGVLKPHFRYHLSGFTFDAVEGDNGPPRALPLDVVEQLYGHVGTVTRKSQEPDNFLKERNPKSTRTNIMLNVYFITSS